MRKVSPGFRGFRNDAFDALVIAQEQIEKDGLHVSNYQAAKGAIRSSYLSVNASNFLGRIMIITSAPQEK